MRYQLILTSNGIKMAFEIISETFKNMKVWKIVFLGGKSAVLIKIGNSWLQRNEDSLDNDLLTAIGNQIDKICLQQSLSIS
ncbi:hypothetical protein ACVWYG_001172 [Pedobacter sp. UYEF25]